MKYINKLVLVFAAFVLTIAAATGNYKPYSGDPIDSLKMLRNPEITPIEVFLHIEYLASDKLEGRKIGTPGDILAEEYLSNEFATYGLTPAGTNGYLQPFKIENGVTFGENNRFAFKSKTEVYNLKTEDDYTPVSFSSNGSVNGNLYFAGYGIKTDWYNDFKDATGKNIDLTGKVAVIINGVPDSKKTFKEAAKYKQLMYKLSALKDANAAGVIVINSVFNENDMFEGMHSDNLSQKSGIPVVMVKSKIIVELFSANGINLKEIQKNISDDQIPDSFDLQNISADFQIDLKTTEANTANVIGYLEGNDATLKNEVIVIGGHFDHLGKGRNAHSTDPGNDGIYYGADDNASGTAGVLELAQKFSANKSILKRSILFICFSGEEEGLLGSMYFTNSDLFKKYKIVSMINLDMIGRMENNSLVISGVGTSDRWTNLVNEVNKKYNFKLSLNLDGYGGSDHNSFTLVKVPVLFFFTGLHGDYHKPSDEFWKINSKGEADVLNMVYDVTENLVTSPEKITFVESKTDDQPKNKANIKVTLGVIPDFGGEENGFRISGVKPNGPAEKAGMQKGDVITKFNGKIVKNLYDYTDALGTVEPPADVEVIYLRDGKEVTIKVHLEGK